MITVERIKQAVSKGWVPPIHPPIIALRPSGDKVMLINRFTPRDYHNPNGEKFPSLYVFMDRAKLETTLKELNV